MVSFPVKPGWKERAIAMVKVFPDLVTKLPEPLNVHWSFWALPPPGLTTEEPELATSFASTN